MDRSSKHSFVHAFKSDLETAGLLLVVTQSGLTVAESTKLRTEMRAAGATFKVVKNTLARRALEGTKFASVIPHLKGPTAIAYSEDPIAAAKVVVRYAKANEKLSVVAGALGETVLDQRAVKSLADLPSLDELRAKVVGIISAPAQKVVGVLNAPASGLAQVIAAYAKKG